MVEPGLCLQLPEALLGFLSLLFCPSIPHSLSLCFVFAVLSSPEPSMPVELIVAPKHLFLHCPFHVHIYWKLKNILVCIFVVRLEYSQCLSSTFGMGDNFFSVFFYSFLCRYLCVFVSL